MEAVPESIQTNAPEKKMDPDTKKRIIKIVVGVAVLLLVAAFVAWLFWTATPSAAAQNYLQDEINGNRTDVESTVAYSEKALKVAQYKVPLLAAMSAARNSESIDDVESESEEIAEQVVGISAADEYLVYVSRYLDALKAYAANENNFVDAGGDPNKTAALREGQATLIALVESFGDKLDDYTEYNALWDGFKSYAKKDIFTALSIGYESAYFDYMSKVWDTPIASWAQYNAAFKALRQAEVRDAYGKYSISIKIVGKEDITVSELKEVCTYAHKEEYMPGAVEESFVPTDYGFFSYDKIKKSMVIDAVVTIKGEKMTKEINCKLYMVKLDPFWRVLDCEMDPLF